jgi:hypothetical protein
VSKNQVVGTYARIRSRIASRPWAEFNTRPHTLTETTRRRSHSGTRWTKAVWGNRGSRKLMSTGAGNRLAPFSLQPLPLGRN